MSDCTCTNYPANLGNVTIGGRLGVGMVVPATPQRQLQVQSASPDSQLALTDTSPSLRFANNAVLSPEPSMNAIMALATVNAHYGQSAGDVLLFGYGAARGNLVLEANYSGGGANRNVLLQTRGGNVGIGAAAPGRRLHIQSATQDTHLALTDSGPSVLLANNQAPYPTATMSGILALATASQYQQNPGDLLLALYGSQTGRIVVDANYLGGTRPVVLPPRGGNVGINFTSATGPDGNYMLDVNGPVWSRGRLAVGAFGTLPTRMLHIQSATQDTHLALTDSGPSVLLANNQAPYPTATMSGILALSTAGQYQQPSGDLLLATYGANRGNIVLDANYAGGGALRSVILQPRGGGVGIAIGPEAGKALDVNGNSILRGSLVAGAGEANTTPGGNGTAMVRLVNTNIGLNTLTEIQFGTSPTQIYATISGQLKNAGSNPATDQPAGDLVFSTRATPNGPLVERLRIQADGKIFVGGRKLADGGGAYYS